MKSTCIYLLQNDINSVNYFSKLDDILKTLKKPFEYISKKIAHFLGKDKENVKLAILGPNEAGKTTLWNYFAGKPFSPIYKQTEGKETISFEAYGVVWTTQKPKDYKVKGHDINGNEDYIRIYWKDLIKDSDMIIFVFNANKYLENELEYQRDVNQRLQFVKSTIEKQTDGKKRKVWLLGSYADKLKNREEDWKKIINLINKKPYRDISNNSGCYNLTDAKELEKYYQKMFGN